MHDNSILWKNVFGQKIAEMDQKLGFLNLKTNLVINFLCILCWKFLCTVFLHKSHIWEKSCSWDISQNALSRSNFRTKWTISWANWWNRLILACWYGQSGLWTLKWTLSQELTGGINLFFACWCNFMQIKLKVLGVGMVKNGCGQSYDGTLKLTYLKNKQME